MTILILISIALACTAIGIYFYLIRRRLGTTSSRQVEKIKGYSRKTEAEFDFCFQLRDGLYMYVYKQHTPATEEELELAIDKLLRIGTKLSEANEKTPNCSICIANDAEQTYKFGSVEERQKLKANLLAKAKLFAPSELSVHYGQLIANRPTTMYLSQKDKDKFFNSLNFHMRHMNRYQVVASVEHSDNTDKPFRVYLLLSSIW